MSAPRGTRHDIEQMAHAVVAAIRLFKWGEKEGMRWSLMTLAMTPKWALWRRAQVFARAMRLDPQCGRFGESMPMTFEYEKETIRKRITGCGEEWLPPTN